MVFSGKWIFIRFNVDNFKKENGRKSNPDLQVRLPRLLQEIELQQARIERGENVELLEIIKLYYDQSISEK